MAELALPLTRWGFGLAVLAYLGLAGYLVWQGGLRRPLSRAAVAVLVAVLLTGLWALVSWGASVVPGLWPLSMALDMARYAAWFVFLVELIRQGQAAGQEEAVGLRWLAPLSYALPLIGLVALWLGSSGHGLGLAFLTMMLLAVLGLVLVEQLFRNLPEDAQWSAKPISLGLAGTFVYDLYVFSQTVLFGGLDLDALSIRGLVHAALMPLLLLSSSRHRNWIGKIRVSQRLIFHSATLLIVGAYLMLIAAVGYYVRFFGGDWGRGVQLALVFLALVLLVTVAVSRSLRARLRVWLGKHFFRYRYDYREEWLRFTQTLSAASSPQEVGLRVIRGLADMLESPAGALWLRKPEETVLRNTASWNLPRVNDEEPADSDLQVFMQRTGWVVSLDEYRRKPQMYEHLTLSPWLQQQPQAWLLVPLLLGPQLLGFVLLASPRTRMEVNWEVNDLLKTAGRQAASYLAQMQATEALLEARKFEAFSRMSAFVVHDLKNIVTQLSLMMKNAKRLGHNPEFQADMLMTVDNALERMRQLMLQLREGAAPAGAAVGVDLGRIARTLEASVRRRGRSLVVELPQPVATRGHEERMERVIGHLVNNALDATSAEQRVWLRIDRHGSHARVEVGDNGHGMSEAFIRDRLFKPFESTKKAGMGIGAYESFQYVQELGGKVDVRSREGEGTVVTLLLPLIESFTRSDLQTLEEA
jgi:putative PEP-CTERM system histidine kinase